MLDLQTQAEILHLSLTEKLSGRAIARRLRIHRRTVSVVLQRKRVEDHAGSRSKQPSILEPYYPLIDKLLREDIARPATNVLQKLHEAGYTGGFTILKDRLRIRRPPSEPQAYLSLKFLKGQAAQVDWGDFGDIFGLGRKVWCFVMVLCWSRMLYLEFTLSANFESFLRCHEHAFRFFGGVPQECWYDNLASAVAERHGRIIRFNPRFFIYSGWHGFKPIACNLQAGHEKGRVEDGVKFIRSNFWPGRSFKDRGNLNHQGTDWRDIYANKRTHRTTRRIPELMWQEEKPSLMPLREGFDTDEVHSTPASQQFRVAFDCNQYSVPWRLASHTLTVRGDDEAVSIYYKEKCLTRHKRSWAKHEVIVNPKHEEGLRERKPGAQPDADILSVKSLGPHASRYLEYLPAQCSSIRSELKRLMVLITVYGPQAVEEIMGRVLELGVVGAVHLERLLAQDQPEAPKPAPLELDDSRLQVRPIRPNLQSYDALLLEDKNPKGNAHGTDPQPTQRT